MQTNFQIDRACAAIAGLGKMNMLYSVIKIYYEIMCHNFKFAIKIFRQLNPSF
jgi:hypothetical protein